tara:strand:+ start:8371 stop:9447 length:1077 start_codon:yes stop_codon:yes gene_type:complete
MVTTTAGAASFEAAGTKVNLGGYAKFDASYLDPGRDLSGTVITAATLPLKGDTTDSTVDFSARESRLWLKTKTETENGVLNTHLEGDFYGGGGNEFASNSYGLRLRHAYGTLNGWLMGQTWSTFMDLAHFGELLDFGQHKSTAFIRQAQVRYTHSIENGALMFALENPQSYIVNSAGTVVNTGDKGRLPDIIARYKQRTDWGQASAAVMLREFKFDNDTRDTGMAVSLNAKINLPNKDDIRMQFNAGALGRYMGMIVHPGAVYDGTSVSAVDSFGASLAYRHIWGEGLRSTLMVSGTGADVAAGSGLAENSQSVHLNLLWDLNKQVRMGIEAQHSAMALADNTERELTRLQFSTRYLF